MKFKTAAAAMIMGVPGRPEECRSRLLRGTVEIVGVLMLACSGPSTPQAEQQTSVPLRIVRNLNMNMAGLESITALDVYVDAGVTHVLLQGRAAGRDLPALRYLRSEDGGATWSKPSAVLSSDFALRIVSKRPNDIQIAAAGQQLVATWKTAGEFPGMGPMVSAISTDGGKTWEPGGKPADSDAVDQGYMDLHADSSAHFHLVWLDDREERGNTQGLRYARSVDGGRHWSESSTLDDTTCTCCWTTLAISGGGVLQVLYRDAEPHDMALAQSIDGGKTWRRLGPVGNFNWNFKGCPHAGGGLAAAGNERTLHSVVWTGREARSGLYHLRSDDGGATWTEPRFLADPKAKHGDIAAIDENRIAIVWDLLEPEASVILATQSLDGGRSWSRPQQLSAKGLNATHPRLATTPRGFLALWTEQRIEGLSTWSTAMLNQ